MKKIIIPLVIIVAIIGLFAFIENRMTTADGTTPPPPGSTPPPAGATATIHMNDTGYDPKNLTIERGTTVTFVNDDTNDHWPASNIHPTHDIYPEFDPQKAVKPGESWSFTFDKAGIWRWHDHLFPSLSGTITVGE